ncbi:MAG: LuxR C-terminal-related transcriptional regulator [Pseudomonadota bacterium]
MLTQRDMENTLCISKTALECTTRPELEEYAIATLQRSLGAASGLYLSITGAPKNWQFENGLSLGTTEEGPALWCKSYQSADPFVAQFLRDPTGDSQVVVSSQLVRHRDYVRSRFYRDFLEPQSVYHVLLIGLVCEGQPIGVFGFHNPPNSDPFDSTDAAKAALLAPFLSAAMQKVEVTELAKQRQWIVSEFARQIPGQGIIVLDQRFVPQFIDPRARSELGLNDGAWSNQVFPDVLTPVVERCNAMQSSQSRGDQLDTGRVSLHLGGEQQLEVDINIVEPSPGKTRYLLHINPREAAQLSNSKLQQFGLTRRQTDIAKLVSLGLTNPEIAEKLCLSVRTVQNHLRTIYAKAKVRNRTSLARKLS